MMHKEHYGIIQSQYIGQHEVMNNTLNMLKQEIVNINNNFKLQLEKHKNELQQEKHKNELKDKDIEILELKLKLMNHN
jgi:hypothetical protein